MQHWREFIEAKEQAAQIEAIKGYTIKGRPLGSDLFISGLEEKLGRVLKPKTRGRPKKEMVKLLK